jgi:hypothetical protein
MRHLLGLGVIATLLLAASAPAIAKHYRFRGAHPIAARFGGGYCQLELPHYHGYAPDRAPLYDHSGGVYVFTGDPTPFGYEGPTHKFYGHHPILIDGGEPVFCYINGPHVHSFEAPESPDYKIEGGVTFYVGPFPPAYVRGKYRAPAIAAEYREYPNFRPVVEVTPPPEWHGEVYVAGPSVEVSAPGIEVRGPSVVVAPPPPPMPPPPPRVVVRGPSVHVSHPGVVVSPPGVYVAPPGVYVAPPPPPHVRVVAPGPPPPPGVVVYEEEHDRGRHKGHYKR